MDLHPFLTHFPIALLGAVLILEVRSLLTGGRICNDTSRWLLSLAIVATVASFYSGYGASDMANRTFIVPDDAISRHHTWGRFLLFAAPITGVLQLAAARARYAPVLFRMIYLCLLLISVALSTVTGYYGGELVFRYGAGVTAPR